MGARILQRIPARAGCPRRSDGVRESDGARKHGGGYADSGQAVMATSGRERSSIVDLVATDACAVVWGTSWDALTLHLGVVDPVVSLVHRFSLAAALLFLGCIFRAASVRLSLRPHKAAAGVGLFSFTLDYSFTRCTSVLRDAAAIPPRRTSWR